MWGFLSWSKKICHPAVPLPWSFYSYPFESENWTLDFLGRRAGGCGSCIARRFFPSEPLGKPNSCLPSVYFLSILLKKTLTLPTIIKAIAEVYSTTFYKRTTLSCSPRIQGCYEMQSSQWDISYAFLGVFVFLFFIYSSFGLLYGCTNVLLGGAAILTRDN